VLFRLNIKLCHEYFEIKQEGLNIRCLTVRANKATALQAACRKIYWFIHLSMWFRDV